jgi:hypothetical protein
MAIHIRGKTRCSICGEVIRDGEDWVGTPHFLHDDKHPLWRFSDSSMHRVCFVTWEHAEEFRDLYDRLLNELVPAHPRRMLGDGTIVPTACGSD